MIYLRLFYEFFKTGLFAIGGGLATLPFLSKMSETTGWFTKSQLADMIAVSESTPGPMGVNMATYVGFVTGGISGAVVATAGLVAPSIIVILIVAAFLKAFKNNPYVASGFYGLRPASTGLIAAAGIGVISIALFGAGHTVTLANAAQLISWKAVILMAVMVVLTRFVPKVKDLHPIVFILIAAAAGMIFHFAG